MVNEWLWFHFSFLGYTGGFRAPKNWFHEGEYALDHIEKYVGQTRMNTNEIVALARESLLKSGYGPELTHADTTPEIEGPSTLTDGRHIPYCKVTWCRSCPLRKLCTRNKNNRTLTREQNEHLMEQMAERMKAPEKFKLRKTLAEHPFGTIKRWMGYMRFTLKELEKVRTEWSLITLAYNLKRVLNLVRFEKLMTAAA